MSDFDIERNLQRPTGVGPGVRSPAALIDLAEAPVRSRTRGQSKLSAVYVQIAFDIWITVCVHDADDLARTAHLGETVGSAKMRGAIP